MLGQGEQCRKPARRCFPQPISPEQALVPLPQAESGQECQHNGHTATAHSRRPKPSVSRGRSVLGACCSSSCWGDTKAGDGAHRDPGSTPEESWWQVQEPPGASAAPLCGAELGGRRGEQSQGTYLLVPRG